ncbi:MAG: DUF2478 domain-containing protein [Polyangiaceae bacterium]|nr:DUF2478 domain-containing protein [Polyangiaceae bacterium]
MAAWALISGSRGVDKSRVAAAVVAALTARGLTVGGVLQAPLDPAGARQGHVAVRVGSAGERVALGRRGAPIEGSRPGARRDFCGFVFDDDAFAEARGWVREASLRDDVVLIDEVSKVETARAGHHDAVQAALAGRAIVVLVVRAEQLFDVVERFSLGDALAILDAEDDAARSAFVDAVARAARGDGTT